MRQYQLGEVESRFAKIIWRNEPLTSSELVNICQKELNWHKSTTYTVLRKLCQRGIFQNVNSVVTSCISEKDFDRKAGEKLVDERFGGSLPAFIAAFTSGKKLKKSEIAEIKKIISDYEKKGK